MKASNTMASGGPNPSHLIASERQRRDFSLKSMHEFIEGSAAKSNTILDLYQSLERDVVLQSNFSDYDLATHANRLQTTQRIARMAQYLEQDSPDQFMRRLNLITVYDPSLGIRISVNMGLFGNCIKGTGTTSQYNYWCVDKQASSLKHIWGCFGMTELGHGSNVAGCETTATFDHHSDEFVINTPHIGATKWWIGGAAHSATHCTVYARLIVDGKDYGVKTFVVPLRDANHNLLPGVAIGDIGAKMGREGVDNGWIQFSNVKIPRFFMLQKWTKVSRDGKVTLPPLEQLSYISLLGGRVLMATDSYRICARFTTIAIRYAVGRLQFKKRGTDEKESQLIDYTLHQKRLLPYLALTYAMAIGTNQLESQHESVLAHLEHAIAQNDTAQINNGIEQTKSLFVDSGAIKSTLTWLAADCISESRQACGGQGYSSYNGFGKSYDDWVVQCTWEGDNNVLGMSAGKSIIKHVDSIVNRGKYVTGTASFLNNAVKELQTFTLDREDQLKDPRTVLKAVEALISRMALSCLQTLKENGDDWDAISHERVTLSKLRCHQYLLEAFIKQLSQNKDSQLNPHLTNVMQLYYLTSILSDFAQFFLVFGVLSPQLKITLSSKLILHACSQVRPQVINLTDAFQQPDNLLHSAIGKFNGDVYENLFAVTKRVNDPSTTKAPYSDQFEALLARQSLAQRQRFERDEAAKDVLSK